MKKAFLWAKDAFARLFGQKKEKASRVRIIAIYETCHPPLYYQENGRFKNERWKILFVDRSDRAHIRSVDRPHVTCRRRLNSMMPCGAAVMV